MKKTKIMHGVFAFVGFFVGTTFMAITMHYQCEGEVRVGNSPFAFRTHYRFFTRLCSLFSLQLVSCIFQRANQLKTNLTQLSFNGFPLLNIHDSHRSWALRPNLLP